LGCRRGCLFVDHVFPRSKPPPPPPTASSGRGRHRIPLRSRPARSGSRETVEESLTVHPPTAFGMTSDLGKPPRSPPRRDLDDAVVRSEVQSGLATRHRDSRGKERAVGSPTSPVTVSRFEQLARVRSSSRRPSTSPFRVGLRESLIQIPCSRNSPAVAVGGKHSARSCLHDSLPRCLVVRQRGEWSPFAKAVHAQ